LADGEDEVAVLSCIVQPEDFEIPAEAAKVHGITTEIAKAQGIALEKALDVFRELAARASLYVAHNIEFDLLVMSRELQGKWKPLPTFCTMAAMTPICDLPGPYGPKWPKLSEAYDCAFNEPLVDAHSALADVRACKRIYEWLQKRREQAEVSK
jgi:DNA polymerase III epsilon subunit-like protein